MVVLATSDSISLCDAHYATYPTQEAMAYRSVRVFRIRILNTGFLRSKIGHTGEIALSA